MKIRMLVGLCAATMIACVLTAHGQAPTAPLQAPTVNLTMGGIGALLTTNGQSLVIVSVVPGAPAEKAGLKPRMIVTRIDGVPTQGRTLTDCVQKIRGAVGTKLKLEVVNPRDDKTNTVTIVRQQIVVTVPSSPPTTDRPFNIL